MGTEAATVEHTGTETDVEGGESLLELLRLTGWRVRVASGRRSIATASRGGLTLTVRGKTRAEAIMGLFEAAIEARHAAARAA